MYKHLYSCNRFTLVARANGNAEKETFDCRRLSINLFVVELKGNERKASEKDGVKYKVLSSFGYHS